MAELPAMPLFGDAYMADTRHLTLEEHGAYHLLLLIAWRSPNQALPDNDRRLAAMLGITPSRWSKLRPAVMAFWTLSQHGWQQKRLLREYEKAKENQQKKVSAAHARWGTKPLETKETANAPAKAAQMQPTPTPLEKEISKDISKKSAIRLPEDWQPSEADLAFAKSKGFNADEAAEEAASFRDYWHGKGGQAATKLDWAATWRNWIRNATRKPKVQKRYVSKSGFEYRGSPEEVRRQAEKRRDLDTMWEVEKDIREARSLGDVLKQAGVVGNA